MRQNQSQNQKRSRGRGRRNNNHNINHSNLSRNSTIESNGPDGRVRGNAQQIKCNECSSSGSIRSEASKELAAACEEMRASDVRQTTCPHRHTMEPHPSRPLGLHGPASRLAHTSPDAVPTQHL